MMTIKMTARAICSFVFFLLLRLLNRAPVVWIVRVQDEDALFIAISYRFSVEAIDATLGRVRREGSAPRLSALLEFCQR